MPQTKSPVNGTVLIVDDTPANLAMLCDLLHSKGFEVLVAESGLGALKQIRFAQPDIILLDVMMPGLDGFETCQRLKHEPASASIPVIFMTALNDTVNKLQGFKLGAVDYVTKPVFPEEVLARIRAHLEIRRLQLELERKNQLLEDEILNRRLAEEELQTSLDQAIAIVGADGGILFATRLARKLLQAFFQNSEEGTLPWAITQWLEAGTTDKAPPRELAPLEVPGQSSTLHTTLIHPANDSWPVLLRFAETSLSEPVAKLQTHGLTPREAEVLFWLSQGKTSPEISIILGAATNTVKKHLANLYQKLGVETRTAAALLARETLRES